MTTAHVAAEQAPSRVSMVLRQAGYWLTVYKRTWRGTAISSFVMPLLYVAAMGVLLGGYVDRSSPNLGGAPSYLAFVAPGLLAAQAMQTATGEVMWPVMGAIKWSKTYYGMIATPLRVSDVVAAHLAFVLFRVATSCGVFVLVLVPFGVFTTWWGAVLAFLAQVPIGLAFAAPLYGFSAGLSTDAGFAVVYRLLIMPLFLFSGAFFPITNLPPVLQTVARVTPLWQGVDLTRMFSLDQVDGARVAVHLAYLLALAAVGWWWALRRLTTRLVT